MASRRPLVLASALAATVSSFVFLHLYLSDLPEPLNNRNFPISAKWHLKRAAKSSDIQEKEERCENAMVAVLKSGKALSSPEATSITVYMAQSYLESGEELSLAALQSVFRHLSHKPHVGEGIPEELSRLGAALRFADIISQRAAAVPLCDVVKTHSTWAVNVLTKCPSYFPPEWKNQPERLKMHKSLLSAC